MKMKKDKSTGMPQLPEGWGPFEVYVSDKVEVEAWYDKPLRIRVTAPSGMSYSQNVYGLIPPSSLTRGDVYKAAKRILEHALYSERAKVYVSPFTGEYPPNKL